MDTETPDDMTPAQRKAIQDAWNLLTEHFDRVLLCVDFEVNAADGGLNNAHDGYWHGGAMSAIGLARFAEDRILHSSLSQNSEPE